MRKSYFQYVILQHPNEEELKAGKSTEVIKQDNLLASSEKRAELELIKQLTDDQFDKIEKGELQIIVRPF